MSELLRAGTLAPSLALGPTHRDEVDLLKRRFRDLVALSTLPAMWSGARPTRIAESLASSLFTTLDPVYVYVGFTPICGEPDVSVAQTSRYQVDRRLAASCGPAIFEWARTHDPDEPMLATAPSGPEPVRIFMRPIGLDARLGVIAAALPASRSFGPLDDVILNVAATQASVAVDNARLLHSLRESDDYLRAAIDSSAGAFYGIDPEGTTTICNAAFVRMIGFEKAEDVIGRRLHGVIRRTRDGHPVPVEACPIYRAARDGVPAHADDEEFHRVDGSSFPVEYWSLPIVRGGKVRGAVTTVIDISERKRVEESLKEADRRKDEFLATLSHELRNPLAPLRNSLHLLRIAGLDAKSSAIHQMMERQVNHMVRLVDDLLEVSRISRGALELRRERVEISTIVRTAVETSQPLIEEARHGLTIDVPHEPLWVDGDLVRLSQVLANLLNNAARYTKPGGDIQVHVHGDPGWASIAVRDNGIGIPAGSLSRIFDMFSRGEGAHDSWRGGLGIGLALARKLAQMHGGDIAAKSGGPGLGSEFVFRLPRSEAPAEAPGTSQPRAARVMMRVLVVDDNIDACESLAMVLRYLGADVRVAYDGHHAIDMLKTFPAHAVLLDIGMPGIDGYETARRIRSEITGRAIMLVALTGWGQEEDRCRATAAGFDHHLVKPADIAAIQDLLSRVETAEPSRTSPTVAAR